MSGVSRRFDVVVAADEAGGIGRDGRLPWRLPGEMKHFVALTRGGEDEPTNAVIMGRATWISIPERFRPLAGRRNVVLSRTPDFAPEGAEVARSFEEALALVAEDAGQIFVIGGGALYREALAHPECRSIYLTRVCRTFDCDTSLPVLEPRFRREEVLGEGEDDGIRYRFERWGRARPPGRSSP